jgi:hypothetical protein
MCGSRLVLMAGGDAAASATCSGRTCTILSGSRLHHPTSASTSSLHHRSTSGNRNRGSHNISVPVRCATVCDLARGDEHAPRLERTRGIDVA